MYIHDNLVAPPYVCHGETACTCTTKQYRRTKRPSKRDETHNKHEDSPKNNPPRGSRPSCCKMFVLRTKDELVAEPTATTPLDWYLPQTPVPVVRNTTGFRCKQKNKTINGSQDTIYELHVSASLPTTTAEHDITIHRLLIEAAVAAL